MTTDKITFGHAVPLEFKALPEDGTFDGYASTYGNIDSGGDIVRAGAFDASLRVRPAGKVKMLLQHDRRDIIGAWESVASDQRGLFVRGKLLLGVQCARDTYERMKAGQLDGMSIGYKTLEDEYDSIAKVRTIVRAELQEVSIVTFPMNEQATVTGVKSADDIDTIETLSDAERYLREADAPFSRKTALDFVSRVKRIAQREAGDDQGDTLALHRLADFIRSQTPKP